MKSEKKSPRIYILPTRFGIIFIVGSATMILIGAAYQNNLVNLLAFFMLSLIFIAMIQTHNNLKDVALSGVESEGGFAGREFLVSAIVASKSTQAKFNLEAGIKKSILVSAYENMLPLLPGASLKLKNSYVAGRRGQYPLQRVKLSTVYPLGLFRAWVWFDTEANYFIYPEPRGELPFPEGGAVDDYGQATVHAAGDDFHGHRKYQAGDSFRKIDWKAHARGRPLLVKEFNEGSPRSVNLDWNDLRGLDHEARLSQLSAWIEEAVRRKLPFSLRLPGIRIPEGYGRLHAVRCWESLAKHDAGASS